MIVTKRAVDTKRHTIGYLIGGRWKSRPEAVKLAKQGKVDGVTVRVGGNDEQYIASVPHGPNLYDLEDRVFPEGKISSRSRRR